ncbi:unnamed protein product [Ceratitis capitata]|uniref:(Mediterranean fruit fly) hypothetical protein n=1 Tax=Ceratitis capitata TaxID=7213 RepID=A0A811VEM0_CERCA|nr:unnamed protein product [Ceratitis capitata]
MLSLIFHFTLSGGGRIWGTENLDVIHETPLTVVKSLESTGKNQYEYLGHHSSCCMGIDFVSDIRVRIAQALYWHNTDSAAVGCCLRTLSAAATDRLMESTNNKRPLDEESLQLLDIEVTSNQ